MTVTPTERVLDLLHARDANVRRQGQGHTAKCPAHDDRKNSLSIREGDDGRVLLHCFARCDVARIVAALGLTMRDLFPNPGPPPRGSASARGRIVATYDYVDADGRLLYQAVRFEPKRFLQRRPDGHGGWIWNLEEAPRVLYRLPDLLAADHATAVFICEGEKDVDRLHNLGLVATTNAMGASAWRPEYADALHGRHVVILPDNDDAGREHAQEIARSLWTVAASIKLMVLPDLPSKGDVSDWLDAGNTAENLKSLVGATPPWTSGEGSTDDSGSTPSGDSLPPFPTEIFPPAVRRYVEEGSAALDVPVEMIALPLLGFAAGAIGNSRRIRLKHGYEQGSALWLAVIGRPGSGKTPALDYARHPVDVLQAEASARFRVALREWEHRVNVHKVDKLPGGPPERPREPGYYAVDATWEALAPMLEASPGLALVRDELVAWVRSHDAYRKGGDRQNWLSLWAGTPLKVNRRTSAPIFVPHPSVSVIGGIQPDLLPALAAEGHRADGFLDRFLPIYPASRYPAWTEATTDPRTLAEVVAIFRRLRPIPPPVEQEGQTFVCDLNPNARATFAAWYHDNQAIVAESTGLAAGCYAKYPNQLARLTLVLHALRYPSEPARSVNAQTLGDGITLLEYLRAHLRRVLPQFGAVPSGRTARLVLRVQRILERAEGGWVDRTTINAKLGGHTPSAEITDALAELEQGGVAERRTVPPRGEGGRPREEWRARASEKRKYGETSEAGAVSPVLPYFRTTESDDEDEEWGRWTG